MKDPRCWLKHLKARRAVASYPLYDVPHKRAEEELGESQVHENFEYFMRVRQDRLAFFREWMSRHFRLNLSLDGESIIALEDWIWDYGGGLLKEEPNMHQIYGSYQPLWVGSRSGYNVAIDIAIFVGEFLISRRPLLYWTHCAYSLGEDGQYTETRMHRPYVGGFPFKEVGAPLLHHMYTFGSILTSLKQSKLMSVMVNLDNSRFRYSRYRAPRSGLVYMCRSCLYLANVTDDGRTFVYGDYSNEPL